MVHSCSYHPCRKIIASAIVLVLIGFGVVLSILSFFFSTNFHTVIPGQVYRSAYLTPQQLRPYVAKYHIKSMINLIGTPQNESWYSTEIKLSKQLGIRHYDVDLHAHTLPTKKQLITLVQILQTAPRPLLIHCKRGADRTGLVAAMSLILAGNTSLQDLERQISWRYKVFSCTTIGYQVMKNYFAWLQQQQLPHNKTNFLRWVNSNDPLPDHYFGWFLTR